MTIESDDYVRNITLEMLLKTLASFLKPTLPKGE